MQLQLLKRLDDHVEAGGVERLDNGRILRQLSLRHDNEVQVPKAHVHAQDPTEVVTGHPRPSVDVKKHKKALPGMLIVGVSSCHRLVNF